MAKDDERYWGTIGDLARLDPRTLFPVKLSHRHNDTEFIEQALAAAIVIVIYSPGNMGAGSVVLFLTLCRVLTFT